MDRKRVVQWTIILLMLCTCKMPFKFKNSPPQPHINEISYLGARKVSVKLYAEDPENDKVSIKVDFGDGYITDWSEFVRSGYILEFTHQYSSSGNYTLKIQAKDENGATSDWSTAHEIVITNNPPNAPIISGPDSVHVNESVTFTASATDPDNDDVAIRFSWGDGNTSNWSSYVPSGQPVSMSHTYTTASTYYVKAQAKDEYGATSDWSTAFTINVSIIWVKTDLGSGGDWMRGIAVGDGRGDGKPRVYAACDDYHVYEFEWTGSSWVKTDLGSGSDYMYGVAVGDGRGDGKPRVYAACIDWHVYEFEWTGSSWVKRDLGASYPMYGVAVGDGRGDGKPRVYAACIDYHVYEFEWTGSEWVKRDLGSGGYDMYGVAVGDGRGDGKPRVYAACRDDHVYEFKWTGSGWVKTDLGSGGDDMYGVAVGDGRGDGKPRVYATCGDYHVYEFEWTGGSWVKTNLGSDGYYMVAVGDGRGDGKPRVYAACIDCHVYEFEWTGSGWVKIDLGSGGHCMFGVTVGDGRGDGKPRVYATCLDHHVYEFECKGVKCVCGICF